MSVRHARWQVIQHWLQFKPGCIRVGSCSIICFGVCCIIFQFGVGCFFFFFVGWCGPVLVCFGQGTCCRVAYKLGCLMCCGRDWAGSFCLVCSTVYAAAVAAWRWLDYNCAYIHMSACVCVFVFVYAALRSLTRRMRVFSSQLARPRHWIVPKKSNAHVGTEKRTAKKLEHL